MSNAPSITRRAGPRFVLRFAAGYVTLHLLYLLLPDAWLAERAYYRLITVPAAAAIRYLDADSAVRAQANVVVAAAALSFGYALGTTQPRAAVQVPIPYAWQFVGALLMLTLGTRLPRRSPPSRATAA